MRLSPRDLLAGFYNSREKNIQEFELFFEKHTQYWKKAVFQMLIREMDILMRENDLLRTLVHEDTYQAALKDKRKYASKDEG